jgi:hypothetical protein
MNKIENNFKHIIFIVFRTTIIMKKIFNQKIISILFLLAIFQVLPGQNILTNPGFESGATGWNSFWSRDGKGSAAVVSDTVHSGSKALHIIYKGIQDWSFACNTSYSVSSGDLIEISAWVSADSITGDAELSVELIDSNNNVINWIYGSCVFSKKGSTYVQFSNKFIIPSNTRKIIPRLVGSRYCNIFVDDISVAIDANVILPDKKVMLYNDTLQVSISYPSMTISALNKITSKIYNTEPKYEYTVSSIDT